MAKASEQVKAQVAETEAKVEAELKEMNEAVKEQAAASETAKETPNEIQKAKGPDPKDMVLITLFKDNERYKDPLLVTVNGRNFLIQRGVDVRVPRYVAEVIQNSLRQDNAAQLMMNRLVEEYEVATLAQK